MEFIKVGIAEYAVSTNGTHLKTTGLGSCVGVALYDEENQASGLLHVMLPSFADTKDDNEAKFADTGIQRLIEDMERNGADRNNLVAKIAGGSAMFQFSTSIATVGDRNVDAVIENLEKHGVPLRGKDVGGDFGRTLVFNPGTGKMTVTSAHREDKEL